MMYNVQFQLLLNSKCLKESEFSPNMEIMLRNEIAKTSLSIAGVADLNPLWIRGSILRSSTSSYRYALALRYAASKTGILLRASHTDASPSVGTVVKTFTSVVVS